MLAGRGCKGSSSPVSVYLSNRLLHVGSVLVGWMGLSWPVQQKFAWFICSRPSSTGPTEICVVDVFKTFKYGQIKYGQGYGDKLEWHLGARAVAPRDLHAAAIRKGIQLFREVWALYIGSCVSKKRTKRNSKVKKGLMVVSAFVMANRKLRNSRGCDQ